MKFEAIIRKDKIKMIENVLTTMIAILKTKAYKHSVFMIYAANPNEIRILIQSEVAPMLLVLQSDLLQKVTSTSKNQTNNSSICFEFQNGLGFLQKFLMEVKEQKSGKNITEEENRFMTLRLAKNQQLRFLEIKVSDKTLRQQIFKPSKNQNEIFTYEWIDGASNAVVHFILNPNNLSQVLKVASKGKITLMGEQKKLLLIIQFQSSQSAWALLKLKTTASLIEASGGISNISSNEAVFRGGIYKYEISIEDAEVVLLALKQSQMIIDGDKNLVTSYSSNGSFNCSISLKSWVVFLEHSGMYEEGSRLKTQN